MEPVGFFLLRVWTTIGLILITPVGFLARGFRWFGIFKTVWYS